MFIGRSACGPVKNLCLTEPRLGTVPRNSGLHLLSALARTSLGVDSSVALPPSAAKVSRNSLILGCKLLTLHLNTFSILLQVRSDTSLEISAPASATTSL